MRAPQGYPTAPANQMHMYGAGHPNAGGYPTAPPFMSANQFPQFQPAPLPQQSAEGEFTKPQQETASHEDKAPEEEKAPSGLAKIIAGIEPFYFLTAAGVGLLCLTSLIPIWDMCKLLYCNTYVYFYGREDPFWIIMCCVLVTLGYIAVMIVLSRFGRKEVHTLHTWKMVFTATLLGLGMGFLMLSVPLRAKSHKVWEALMLNSTIKADYKTEPLVAYYHVLLEERLKPDCIKMDTIEHCKGYEARDPYTGYLKALELNLECSGFGYQKPAAKSKAKKKAKLMQVAPAEEEHAESDGVALIQGSGDMVVKQVPAAERKLAAVLKQRAAKKKRTQRGLQPNLDASWTSLLAVNHTLWKAGSPPWDHIDKQGVGDTGDNMKATGWMNEYPPTLFTDANYKVTCEGAAAREMQYTTMKIANELKFTAIVLMSTAVLAGFARLVSMCVDGGQHKNVDSAGKSVDGD